MLAGWNRYKYRSASRMIAFVATLGLFAEQAAPQVNQLTFATAQEAADALIAAAAAFDIPKLLELFGPDGKELVSSADGVQDRSNIEAFASKARTRHQVIVNPSNSSKATLVVGDQNWPFPVPLVRTKGKWAFNTVEGRDEILRRRIGTNELDAIQVCHGFVAAQNEYAAAARELTGISQYAQKIFSSPGKKDGLFWENPDGSPGGPISKAVANALAEGYEAASGTGYHGYYFTILKGQGPAARFGELDYTIKGLMIGGFALLAVPAEYGVTGILTFMVNYEGVVYQKDFGPNSLSIAKTIDRFNPDKTWKPTNDEWPDERSSQD